MDQILGLVDNRHLDLVLSDMATNLSGMGSVDQPKSAYLAVVLDLYSRRIVGWSMSQWMNRRIV